MGFAVPAAQVVHGARPVVDQDPARQREMQSDLDVDWGGEEYSLGHSRQSFTFTDPAFGLYVPAEHDTHVEAYWAPTLLLQVPAGQAVQDFCPLLVEYRPAGQGMHWDSLVEPLLGL